MPIAVHMPTARDLHRDLLRAERERRWQALDARWFRAAETGDTTEQDAVATAKQALRDAPADARIDAAATPAALATLTIDALTGE